ncbi:MAG: tyrosine--tRNA ligase [Rickettsiales bacterium]|jgi:tyrosyl-tRNA synthetase|nr:tyrosine--tRNA ligase [Rickettsiales bacterium]
MTQKLFDMLRERGFVKDMTHPEQIENILNGDKKITFYVGIDPTADSLHIGHFFALRMARHLQNAGHHAIILIGGATALIGDPTGKSDMRKMMTKEQVRHNLEEVKTLAKRFVLPKTEFVDNADWINKFTYVDFMRLVCVHFNVNTMLASEAYARRRENGGLTFLEMGYMPMQAYDFVHLNREKGCVLQIGGSDQWGNIVAGTELFRKMNLEEGNEKAEIYGLTAPLLMTADGNKMGKTEKGTLWVARDRTTPFDFFQYFYNVPDENTRMLLLLFTDIPIAEIDDMCKKDIVQAKKVMAFEVTKLIHGQQAADEAANTAAALFCGGDAANAPSVDYKIPQTVPNIVDFAIAVGLFPSKSEARRTIEQGGLSVDDQKVTSADQVVLMPAPGMHLMLRKGKKTFLKVVMK